MRKAYLKKIQLSELALKISKPTFGWNNHSDPIKDASELIAKSQGLFLEISEYEQRIGSKLSKIQKNKIDKAIEDLGKLIPYIKNKIKPTESLEMVDKTDNSMVWPWVIYTGLSDIILDRITKCVNLYQLPFLSHSQANQILLLLQWSEEC